MAIETQTVNPAAQPINNGGVITPEAWRAMTPEQKAAYPVEVQNLMNQQEALIQNGIPAGTVPLQPATIPGLAPNQDRVVPPTPQQMGQQQASQPMTLKEQKALLKAAEEGTGCNRDWYEFYKVSFTNSHDISSMIAGALIAGFAIAIVYGVVCLIRKD